MKPSKIETALRSLEQLKKNHVLDEFEQNAVAYIKKRIEGFQSGHHFNPKYEGEIARMVHEFDPSKLDPELGGLLIQIERNHYDGW